jgi:hypothetical protein
VGGKNERTRAKDAIRLARGLPTFESSIESEMPQQLPKVTITDLRRPPTRSCPLWWLAARYSAASVTTRLRSGKTGRFGRANQRESYAKGPGSTPYDPELHHNTSPKIMIDTPKRGPLSPLVLRPRRRPRRRTARCLRSGTTLLHSHILTVGSRMGTLVQSPEAWDRCSPRHTIPGSGDRGSPPGPSPPMLP